MNKYKHLFSDDWYKVLGEYVEGEHFHKVGRIIAEERKKYRIIPDKGCDTFLKVFRVSPLGKVKVIVLGMDPYPTIEENGIHTFDGLAFSNSHSMNPSPSLRNILKEVKDSYPDTDYLDELNLQRWAEQGVLLINVAHTVRKGQPGSHIKLWELFTKYVMKALNSRNDLVWLVWGNNAKRLSNEVDNTTHAIIHTSHPSPLGATKTSTPFLGSGCFKKANKELNVRGKKSINF